MCLSAPPLQVATRFRSPASMAPKSAAKFGPAGWSAAGALPPPPAAAEAGDQAPPAPAKNEASHAPASSSEVTTLVVYTGGAPASVPDGDSSSEDCAAGVNLSLAINWGTEAFAVHPKVFANIPTEFLKIWLSEKSARFTLRWLSAMDSADKAFLLDLTCMLIVMTPGVFVPLACRSKAILHGFLDHRTQQFGRLAHVEQHVINTAYDRRNGGVYKLHFVGGQVREVVHISGLRAQIPSFVAITRDFECEHWWSDTSARMVLRPMSYRLIEFFPMGSLSQFAPSWREVNCEARMVGTWLMASLDLASFVSATMSSDESGDDDLPESGGWGNGDRALKRMRRATRQHAALMGKKARLCLR